MDKTGKGTDAALVRAHFIFFLQVQVRNITKLQTADFLKVRLVILFVLITHIRQQKNSCTLQTA
jgi:hypothetical protein